MTIIVNAIKCLDHPPLTRTFFTSCFVSLRLDFPRNLSNSTSTSLFSVASLSLNFLVPSSLTLLQNLRAFLVSTYFLFRSDYQVFWSISSIVELCFSPKCSVFSSDLICDRLRCQFCESQYFHSNLVRLHVH